jgi:hypothetical protein
LPLHKIFAPLMRGARHPGEQLFAKAQALAAESRPSQPCKSIASGDASASTIASPSAGSLERTAASKAPQAAPAICAKPNKAAATPALLPKGYRAAALGSGLAMPTPDKKIAAPDTNGTNEFLATSTARRSAMAAITVNPRPTSVAR